MGGAERYLVNYIMHSKFTRDEKKILVCLRKSEFYYKDETSEFDEIIYFNALSGLKLLILLWFSPKCSVLLQSFLYRSNIVAGTFHVLSLFRYPHILHIRSGRLERSKNKLGAILQKLVVLCSRLSKTGVIYNSYVGQKFHEKLGFSNKKHLIVWNGASFDLNRQYVENLIESRIESINRRICVTFVGRNDPLKNFNELKKAMIALSDEPNCPMLKVYGNIDVEDYDNSLANILFFGSESDLSCIYDYKTHYLIMTSLDEACPNVLIEAANYGLPIITTDAGDAWLMFGEDKIKINGFLANDIIEAIRSVISNIDPAQYKARSLATWERSRTFEMSKNVNVTDRWIKREFFSYEDFE